MISEKSTYSASTPYSIPVSIGRGPSVDIHNDLRETNPILEQICHESAAQLLTKANDSVLGSGIDLQLEALSSINVVHQLSTVVLNQARESLLQFRVPEERLGSGDMVLADLLYQGRGLLKDLGLGLLGANGGGNLAQLVEDLEESGLFGRVSVAGLREGGTISGQYSGF
jgi:hypothetical protein